MELRQALFELFGEDDGSLPELRIEGLDHDSAAAALSLIEQHEVGPRRYAHVDGPSAPEALRHFVTDLRVGSVDVPSLGVNPVAEAFALDWRMGPEWTEERIRALLGLVRRILRLSGDAHVHLEPGITPEYERHFRKVLLSFLSETAES